MALENEYMFIYGDLQKRFPFFWKKKTKFYDVTLTMGERCIKAHRFILAAAIPYFHRLFFELKKANSDKVIVRCKIDFDVLEALIEYAYSCKVKISVENVKMLLSAACFLQLVEVKDACCQFLAKRLNSENALDIRCYASSQGCLRLVKKIDNLITKQFSEIIETEQFLNISFPLLISFISSNKLNVENEKVVFESALKWVKKCPEERQGKLPEILKNIRFTLLKLKYIKNHVAKEELIRSSLSCRDLLEEAIFHICCPEEEKETSSFCITSRRKSHLWKRSTEAKLFDNEYVFVCEGLPKKSLSFFWKNRTEFYDITIKIGEHCIKAHRFILAAAIPYFCDLFFGPKMANSGKKAIVHCNIESNALEALIEYAYSCKVKISEENVKMLLSAACLLQVSEVKDACCQFLAKKLNLENALDIRSYSSFLGCLEFVKEIDGFIMKQLSKIIETEQFLNISFPLLISFISSDELKVKNEKVIFESALKWVRKCPEKRREKLPEILKNIRFPFLELCYVKNLVANEELIQSSPSCKDFVEKVIYHTCCREKEKETCSFCNIPRRGTSNLQKRATEENLSLCVMHTKFVVECFDLVKEKWRTRKIPKAPCIELSHSMVAVDKKMYFFNSDATHVIDLETYRYSSCTGMRHPRSFTQPAVHKNKFFICGGLSKDFITNVVECFDPTTENWTELTPMRTFRSSMAAVAHEEFLYVLGGWTGTCITNIVEKYNLEAGTWSTSSPMLTTRYAFSCCMLNDKIYVCGGKNSVYEYLSTPEVFNLRTQKWKFITSMNTLRSNCKLVSCCNKLYVLGGFRDKTHVSTVEIYDPETEEWEYGISTQNGQSVICAAVVSLPSV